MGNYRVEQKSATQGKMSFDTVKFNQEIASIYDEEGFTTPLRLAVCVLDGSLSSLIDIRTMMSNLYGSPMEGIFDPDVTIVVDIDEITEEKDTYSIVPTDKKTVTKLLKKELAIKSQTLRFRYKPLSKKSNIKKKKGEDAFYNCVNLDFILDLCNISTKIFPNGKVQIAGCRNLEIANKVIVKIYDTIQKYAKEAIRNPGTYEIGKFKVGMFNTNFRFSQSFYLEELKNKINQHNVMNDPDGKWRNAGYDPSVYPGVNAKYWSQETKDKYLEKLKSGKKIPKKLNGQTSILVFREGNVIITGAKTVGDLREAYFAIVGIVKTYKEEIVQEPDSDSEDDEPVEPAEPVIRNLRYFMRVPKE